MSNYDVPKNEKKLLDIALSELKETIPEEVDEEVLISKIRNAIREVKRARRYPTHYTDEMIGEDLENYISNIEGLALYDYNQVGAEGESTHNESGVNRTWKSRNTNFNGIIPIARV